LCSPVTTSDLSYPLNQFEVEVFPNPADDKLFIGISNAAISNEAVELKVLNLLGETLMSKKISANSSTISIDLNDFSNGLYILEVKQNNKVSVKKFQVNH
jgi:hypothetical protein